MEVRVIDELVGQVITKITNNKNEELLFELEDKRILRMFHWQDCCECVEIEDIVGNLADLIESPIIMAEEVLEEDEDACESGTWTFYKFATKKGYVTIRWYGSSNGYYSESVDLEWV